MIPCSWLPFKEGDKSILINLVSKKWNKNQASLTSHLTSRAMQNVCRNLLNLSDLCRNILFDLSWNYFWGDINPTTELVRTERRELKCRSFWLAGFSIMWRMKLILEHHITTFLSQFLQTFWHLQTVCWIWKQPKNGEFLFLSSVKEV